MAHAPGIIRDSIINYLSAAGSAASVAEIRTAVAHQVGSVAASSVRSYLNLNTPDIFERTGRGCYRLRINGDTPSKHVIYEPAFESGNTTFYHADCFEWLANQRPSSVQAVVTDPPYGLVEYSMAEQLKLANGRGG